MSKPIIPGSWKNKIVSSDLQEERDKKDFTGSMSDYFDPYIVKRMDEVLAFSESDPGLLNSHKFYDMTREEQMQDWYKKSNVAFRLGKQKYFVDSEPTDINWGFVHLGEPTMGMHSNMFRMCVQYIMSDEQ